MAEFVINCIFIFSKMTRLPKEDSTLVAIFVLPFQNICLCLKTLFDTTMGQLSQHC